MEGDSPPPAQPAETAAISPGPTTDSESTDSAPPPSASLPAIPPKSYSTAPYEPPAVVWVRPNSAIPSFIRILAVVLFLAGSASAALAFLYRNVLYPRLVLALAARTKLHAGHLSAYSTLLDRIRALSTSRGFKFIAPPKPTEEEHPSDADRPTPEKTSAEPVSDAAIPPELATIPPPSPPPAVFAPLCTSLHALSLIPTPPPAPLFFDPTATPPATTSLSKSLTNLNDYLAAESFVGFSTTYRNHFGAAGTSTTNGGGVLADAVQNLKAEIRQVKGTLLNRRNFATLSPRGASPAPAGAAT